MCYFYSVMYSISTTYYITLHAYTFHFKHLFIIPYYSALYYTTAMHILLLYFSTAYIYSYACILSYTLIHIHRWMFKTAAAATAHRPPGSISPCLYTPSACLHYRIGVCIYVHLMNSY